MRGRDRSTPNVNLVWFRSPLAVLLVAVPSIFRMADRGRSLDINDFGVSVVDRH